MYQVRHTCLMTLTTSVENSNLKSFTRRGNKFNHNERARYNREIPYLNKSEEKSIIFLLFVRKVQFVPETCTLYAYEHGKARHARDTFEEFIFTLDLQLSLSLSLSTPL